MNAPLRSDLDLNIDTAQLRMLSAQTPELQWYWGNVFTAMIRERNAARTPAEIEQLERERGLRQ